MTLYKWQEPYQAALAEFHTDKLKEKIATAEIAIIARCQELANDSNHEEERLRLKDAVNGLRALQTERLGYPLTEKSGG